MFHFRTLQNNLSGRCLKLCSSQNRLFSKSVVLDQKAPLQAEIVIAGGGVIGTSVAYHLTNLGWKNILLLEQGSYGGGTSWHAAGLCGAIRSTKAETDMCLYAQELYMKMEEEIGVGFKRCGSLVLAQTSDRALTLKKTLSKARQYGVECELVTPEEAGKINPFIRTDDIKLGLSIPSDGVVNPTDLVQAYLKGASKDGSTKHMEGVKVEKVISDGYHVTAVETDHGTVKCDYFVNCAGMWGRELGLKSNPPVDIPLHSSEHFYIVTKPIENVHSMLPVTRDYDARTYVREWSGGLLLGGFEPDGKPCFHDKVPEKFVFQLLQEDWDHFGYLMDGLLNRYPCLKDAEIRSFVNGPESFTPLDSKAIVSKSIEFENYYIAAGMSSTGVVSSAAVGRTISELITYGDSKIEHGTFDVRRMPKGFNNKFLVRDATVWSLRSHYELHYPKKGFPSYNIMNSPLHGLLDTKGAVWSNIGNWETPMYFRVNDDIHKDTFGKPDWLSNVQSEMRSCHESVGILDMTGTSKFDIMCNDGETLCSYFSSLCLHDITTMKNGDIIETILLNDTNGCSATCSLTKVSDNMFCLLTPPNQHTFALSRLKESTRNSTHDIKITDVSGNYTVMGLIGPNAESLLNEILPPPHNTSDVQKGTCMVVDIGYASQVQLFHHCMGGLNGWSLFVPTEFSQGLYRLLMQYGEKYSIRNTGHFALDSLRIEQKRPVYGNELGARTDFNILKELYENDQEAHLDGLKLLEVYVPSKENWPWGGEQVLYGDQIIGNLTSVGYTLDDQMLLGITMTNTNDLKPGTKLRIQCGMDLYNATAV